MSPQFLSSLCLFFLLLHLPHTATAQLNTDKVQGQDQVNILRHTVAVSNLPSQFGKHGHILLSRSVVPIHHIWEAPDGFTLSVLSRPERLDWYVADYSTDARRTVTINAGFSCLDVGQSTARPLTWWASDGFTELKNKSKAPGGAEIDESSGGDGSINDITARCFNGRKSDPDLRLVEHNDQHRGVGVSFTIPKIKLPTSIVGNSGIFQEIEEQRLAEDRSNAVIYHSSGLPVAIGLTFDTGMRLRVPANFRTDRNIDLRVPITPLSAITKHSGARLEEARVAESQTSTNTSILMLTVFSTGLPLLLAVWWVVKHISDTMVEHSRQCQKLPTHEAVDRIAGWTVQEKVLLVMNLFGVSILAAPFALAVADGTIDPRISVEVTTGATVLYGSSQPGLSEDPNNPVAGAPYVLTVWMSVRHLGDGFVLALSGSLLLILFLAIVIFLTVSKKSNEMMPGSKSRWPGFSIWKLCGSLRLFAISLQHGEERRYKMLVEFYDDVMDETGAVIIEGKKKELMLMQAQEMRERANKRFFRKTSRRHDQQIKRLARESLHEELRKYGRSKFRLLCRVRMDNRRRYEAALSQSTVFDRHLPREWEYVRRSRKCEGIDWYRTNGRMPPDDALIFARLGLLEYMKYVKRVVIKEDEGTDMGEFDEDGVNTVLIVTPVESFLEEMEFCGDSAESRVLDHRDEAPNLFKKKMSTDTIGVTLKPGIYKEAVKYGGEMLQISFVVIDEDEALALCNVETAV